MTFNKTETYRRVHILYKDYLVVLFILCAVLFTPCLCLFVYLVCCFVYLMFVFVCFRAGASANKLTMADLKMLFGLDQPANIPMGGFQGFQTARQIQPNYYQPPY